MTDEAVVSNLSADRPIKSLEEDLLDRGDFVIPLATAIRQWKGADSLVLGLYGPWGHGKTSVKNLILSLLAKTENSPGVVEFNPWNWTGEDRILAAFFEEVGLAISKDASGPDREQLALKWKQYATRLTLGGTALEHLRTAAEIVGIPWVPLILGLLSKTTQSAATVSEQVSDVHSAEAAGLDQTVETLKQHLHDELARLERPILVVMDDIDRLTKEEIRLLFRLIKSNADFPNLIYLLVFERKVVEKALEGVTGSNGRAYMEKIIQAGFDLPKVKQSDIDHALTAGLDELLRYDGIAEGFESDRWQNLYRDALRPFFQSLRDVRRFLSTFSFELGLFYRNKALDINFIDLIGLEVLRVFEPDLHLAVANSKEMLIRTPYAHMFGRDEKEQVLKQFSPLLEIAHEERREAAKAVLAGLFPKIEWALKGYGYGKGFEDGWEQSQRVCHYRMFDRYFIMNIPKGEVRLSLLKTIKEITSREKLVKLLTELHGQGLLGSAIERLEAHKTTLDVKYAKEFITGLLDIDDLIPFEPGMSFGLSTEMSLIRLIHHYMLQKKDKSARSKLMVKCIKDCKGVWLPVRFVALEEPDPKEKDLDRFVFDDDGLKEAKDVCLSKMRNSNLKGIFDDKLASCLFRWRDWAGIEEPRKWCAKQATDLSGALRLLRAFLQTSYVSGGSGTVEKHVIKLEYLDEFTDLEVLKSTLEPLLADKPVGNEEYRSEYETEIVAFRRALRRREKGEGDDWRFDED